MTLALCVLVGWTVLVACLLWLGWRKSLMEKKGPRR